MSEQTLTAFQHKTPARRPDYVGAGANADARKFLPAEKDEIRAALCRVLRVDEFAASQRMSSFLTYVVEQTLAGGADRIKGYTIAVEALGRPDDHDPQADPGVRVLAGRLRRALALYYSGEGTGDPVEIEIPKGGYVPQFVFNAVSVLQAADRPRAPQVKPGSALPRLRRDCHEKQLKWCQRVAFDQIAALAARMVDAVSAIVTIDADDAINVLGSYGVAAASYDLKYSLHGCFDDKIPVIIIEDVAADPRLRNHPIRTARPAVRRLIVVPIRLARERCGDIVIFDPSPDAVIGLKHGTLLCDLATLASTQIEMMNMPSPPVALQRSA